MIKDNSTGNKSSSNPQSLNYDSPWKQIIEELFESFPEFFFPKIVNDIDFSKGYEVKSKELYKLLKDQYIGKRYTDGILNIS